MGVKLLTFKGDYHLISLDNIMPISYIEIIRIKEMITN